MNHSTRQPTSPLRARDENFREARIAPPPYSKANFYVAETDQEADYPAGCIYCLDGVPAPGHVHGRP